MAIDKFLALITDEVSHITSQYEVTPLTTSTQDSDSAYKIPASGADGRLDESWMPVGVAAEVQSVVFSETLSDWDLVNVYDDSGTLKARKADAGTNQYKANGFVHPGGNSGTTGNVFMYGVMSGGIKDGESIVPGEDYFLTDTPGKYSAIAPYDTGGGITGKLYQKVGWGMSTATLFFQPEQATVRS